MCKNCPKCGKGFKISTNETYSIKIKFRVGGNLKIFCFCLYANIGASDKGISLRRKILEKVLTLRIKCNQWKELAKLFQNDIGTILFG